MATSFEELQHLLVLSGPPVAVGTPAEWSAAHQLLGRRLPIDYLRFVATYGHCVIDDNVSILNPFAEQGRFWDDLERERSIDREDINVTPPDDPGAFYPRPKGMIPWGSTDDGGSYLWVTNGDADRWTVFVEWDLSSAPYALGMEDFLLAGLRQELDAFAFGVGFPTSRPAYVDPVVQMSYAHVRFDPPLHWGLQEVETLCRVFGMRTAQGNGLTVRPERWRLVWHDGLLLFDVLPDDIDGPKPKVAALAAALGASIVEASPESWMDLVI